MRFNDYEWLIWTEGKKRSGLKALFLHLHKIRGQSRSQFLSKY